MKFVSCKENNTKSRFQFSQEYYFSHLISTKHFFVLHTGGWSLVNIPGDGMWSVNSSQFIREKLMGNNAFYRFIPFMNVDTREYMLLVSVYALTNVSLGFHNVGH